MSNYRPEDLAACAVIPDHAVPDLFIAPLRRAAAAWGAREAAKRLGGRVPSVKFFKRSAETGTVYGCAVVGGDEIFVAADLSPAAMAGVAAHETVHALGSSSESECAAMQRDVQAEWPRYRWTHRGALAQWFTDSKARWETLRRSHDLGSPVLSESLCQWTGVQPFQAALAGDELALRCDELEEWGPAATAPSPAYDASPTAHLRLKQAPPPQPLFSFSRWPR